MFELLGPGLFGFSFILELVMGAFILMTYRPHFPYIRVITFLIAFYVIFIYYNFGNELGLQLVESIWNFLGRSAASVVG